MKNYKIEAHWGEMLKNVSARAKEIAIDLALKNTSVDLAGNVKPSTVKLPIVEFDFNGIKCLVDSSTNIDWLYRDYNNAHLMGWKSVGSNCVEVYSKSIQAQITLNEYKAEERANKRAEEYRLKEEKEKLDFQEKVKGIELDLIDSDYWNTGLDNNKDSYGKCVYEYAEGWAKLMQFEISNGKTLIECAEKTSFEMGFLGITGFMYGASVNILSKCWKYGEELRKWHNKEYDYDGDGCINPAILTLNTENN